MQGADVVCILKLILVPAVSALMPWQLLAFTRDLLLQSVPSQ